MAMDRARVQAALSRPEVGVGLAAGVLAIAAAVVVALIGPAEPETAVRLSLAPVAQKAPAGWREALRASRGLAETHGAAPLSDHPLADGEKPAMPLAASEASGPLPPAPLDGVFTQGPNGPLPIIAKDGRTPFQVYARPFAANGRPKVSLVIGGLGLNSRATRQAIETLPGAVTLAFSPYADGLQGWIDLARQHGHEVLLETPMEPLDYPDNDPGPSALMVRSPATEIARRMEWLMSRGAGYMGLTNYLGSRFLADETAYDGFAQAAKGRGLAFIDNGVAAARTGGGLPRASAGVSLDDQLDRQAIDQKFLALEAQALQKGQALGWAFAYPVSLETAAAWAASVEQRGYQLAPASALASRP